MFHEIAAEAGKSLLRQVGEDIFKKGSAALVVEGIKTGLAIWKSRRVRLDEYEFEAWKKARSDENSKDEASTDTDADPDSNPGVDQESE